MNKRLAVLAVALVVLVLGLWFMGAPPVSGDINVVDRHGAVDSAAPRVVADARGPQGASWTPTPLVPDSTVGDPTSERDAVAKPAGVLRGRAIDDLGTPWGAFGTAVDIDGGRVLVGEPGGDGSAALFELLPSPSLSAQLDPQVPGVGSSAEYGSAVALQGDIAVVGAAGHDFMHYDIGSAWVWHDDGTGWSLVESLMASDAATSSNFGRTLWPSMGSTSSWAPTPARSTSTSGTAWRSGLSSG